MPKSVIKKKHDEVKKQVATLKEQYAIKVKDASDLPELIRLKDEINFLSGQESAYSDALDELE